MNVRKVLHAFLFINCLKLSLELDILSPILLRNQALLNLFSGSFNRNEFKNALNNATNDISTDCLNDIQDLFDPANLHKSELFFDAWSSLPASLLYGQETSLGNFDECQRAAMFSTRQYKLIKGEYSLLSSWVDRPHRNSTHFIHLLSFGVCLPESCGMERETIFSKYFGTISKLAALFGKKAEKSDTRNVEVKYSLPSFRREGLEHIHLAAYFGICVITSLLGLVCLSTVYEIWMYKLNGRSHELLKSFSVINNFKFLFRIDVKENCSTNYIRCVDGIRSLSLIWNIFGHAFMWSLSRSETNTFDRVDWLKTPFSRALTSANVVVDTFLLMTGLLLTWIWLHKLEKNGGRTHIRLMYLHRFLRVTPAFAVTVLFATGLYTLLGDGPLWNYNTLPFAETCQKSWGKALLYISNYASPEQMCIGHSWYLATDMQLFILMPFILIGLSKWRKMMLWLLVTMIFLSCYWSFNSILHLHQKGFAFEALILGDDSYLPVEYYTHMRMGPWIIGVIYGYYMFQHRSTEKKFKQCQVLLGWIVSLTIILLVVFGPQHLAREGKEASTLEAAVYESFGRCSWALGVGWIIFACHMGYSESVNSFLSHPLWQPIARLNYSTYLVKTFVDNNNLALQKTEEHFSNYEIIGLFWSNFGLSLSFAIFLALLVELPFMSIENYFLKKKRMYKLIA